MPVDLTCSDEVNDTRLGIILTPCLFASTVTHHGVGRPHKRILLGRLNDLDVGPFELGRLTLLHFG